MSLLLIRKNSDFHVRWDVKEPLPVCLYVCMYVCTLYVTEKVNLIENSLLKNNWFFEELY